MSTSITLGLFHGSPMYPVMCKVDNLHSYVGVRMDTRLTNKAIVSSEKMSSEGFDRLLRNCDSKLEAR